MKNYRSGSMWILGLTILVLLLMYLLPGYMNMANVTIQQPNPIPTSKVNYTAPIIRPNITTIRSIPNVTTMMKIPASLNKYTIILNGNSTLLNILLKELSLNASVIPPSEYQKFLQIASTLYASINGYASIYTNNNTVVGYPSDVSLPSCFPNGWSYPPSDLVKYNVSYRMIGHYNVETNVTPSVHSHLILVKEKEVGNCSTKNITYYYYYDANVSYNYSYYVIKNGTILKVGEYSGSLIVPYDNNSNFTHVFLYNVTVPPGVNKTVYVITKILWEGATSTKTEMKQCNGSQIPVKIISYYPVINSSVSTFNRTWHAYNITLSFNISVYNGTSPVTLIKSKTNYLCTYNTTINATVWFVMWSSHPFVDSFNITTYDKIGLANYTITRSWHAANITIIPLPINDTSSCYLNFNVTSKVATPRWWIHEKMVQNVTVENDWYHFLNVINLAYTLYSVTKGNLTLYDYYVSIATFYNGFNTTYYYEMMNDSLAMFSIFSPWSIMQGTLNVTHVGTWKDTWIYVEGSQLVNTSFCGLFDTYNRAWLIYDPGIVYATYYDEEPIGFRLTQCPNETLTPQTSVLKPFPDKILLYTGLYYRSPLPYAIDPVSFYGSAHFVSYYSPFTKKVYYF